MSEAKLFIKKSPEPVEVKMQKDSLLKRSQYIWKFLEKRDLIAVNRLAEKVDYDPGNFWRLMNGKKAMVQSLLKKVEKELRLYGLI